MAAHLCAARWLLCFASRTLLPSIRQVHALFAPLFGALFMSAGNEHLGPFYTFSTRSRLQILLHRRFFFYSNLSPAGALFLAGSQSEIKWQRGQIYFTIVAAARNRRVRRVPRRYIFHDLSARARDVRSLARSLAACGMEKLFSLVGKDIFAIMNRARAISRAHMHSGRVNVTLTVLVKPAPCNFLIFPAEIGNVLFKFSSLPIYLRSDNSENSRW